VKRRRDDYAPPEIDVGGGGERGGKRLRLDAPGLPRVATLDSKDPHWPEVFSEAVSKFREEKAKRLGRTRGVERKSLHKFRPVREKGVADDKAKRDRYKIVNKSRGITCLDPETGSYLAKADRITMKETACEGPKEDTLNDLEDKSDTSCSNDNKLTPCSEISETTSKLKQVKVDKPEKSPIELTNGSNKENRSDGACSTAEQSESHMDGLDQINFQLFDVDRVAAPNAAEEEEQITVNGVAMQRRYVYDVYLALLPHGASLDHVADIEPAAPQLWDLPGNRPASDYDSDDSNCEGYYKHDYPDGEKVTAMFTQRAQAAFEGEDEQALFDGLTKLSLGPSGKEQESDSSSDDSDYVNADDPWMCKRGEWSFREPWDTEDSDSDSEAGSDSDSSSSSHSSDSEEDMED